MSAALQFTPSDPKAAVQVPKRKMQNRAAARKYRARKKEKEKSLKHTLSSLKSKNIALIRERDQLTTDLNYLKQVLKDHAHCHVVTRFPVHSQHTTS